jgi:hypothetical protein
MSSAPSYVLVLRRVRHSRATAEASGEVAWQATVGRTVHRVCLLRSLAEPAQTYVGLTDDMRARQIATPCGAEHGNKCDVETAAPVTDHTAKEGSGVPEGTLDFTPPGMNRARSGLGKVRRCLSRSELCSASGGRAASARTLAPPSAPQTLAASRLALRLVLRSVPAKEEAFREAGSGFRRFRIRISLRARASCLCAADLRLIEKLQYRGRDKSRFGQGDVGDQTHRRSAVWGQTEECETADQRVATRRDWVSPTVRRLRNLPDPLVTKLLPNTASE